MDDLKVLGLQGQSNSLWSPWQLGCSPRSSSKHFERTLPLHDKIQIAFSDYKDILEIIILLDNYGIFSRKLNLLLLPFFKLCLTPLLLFILLMDLALENVEYMAQIYTSQLLPRIYLLKFCIIHHYHFIEKVFLNVKCSFCFYKCIKAVPWYSHSNSQD